MVEITIPYNGAFPNTGTAALEQETDILQMTENLFVIYAQQNSQPIGYLGVYEYDDYVLDNDYSRITQQVFFIDGVISVKLFKLSNTFFALVRDRDLYIYELSGIDIIERYSQQDYFIRGLIDAKNISEPSLGVFDAYNLIENQLLVIQNTAGDITFQTGVDGGGEPIFDTREWEIRDPANTVVSRITFNPVDDTIDDTVVIDLSAEGVISTYFSTFHSNIDLIPGTTTYSLSFCPSIVTNNSQTSLEYLAVINNQGEVQSTLPIPGIIGSFFPRYAVVLKTDRIVYINNTNEMFITWNGTKFQNMIGSTNSNTSSSYIGDLTVLDARHFMLIHGEVFEIYRYLSDNLYQTKSEDLDLENGVTRNKELIKKINNDLITIHARNDRVTNNGRNVVQYRHYRLYQID